VAASLQIKGTAGAAWCAAYQPQRLSPQPEGFNETSHHAFLSERAAQRRPRNQALIFF
jgi:hypothetical protein